jgi:hypothetical protein
VFSINSKKALRDDSGSTSFRPPITSGVLSPTPELVALPALPADDAMMKIADSGATESLN